MSKPSHKHYACIHDLCPFRTDKRKAIYTHLIRTHAERKEDYECEYCSSMFEVDVEMERHLHVNHPEQPFTYTCVSRIEKVINNCARLGDETKKSKTPMKSPGADAKDTKTPDSITPTKTSPKNENTTTSPISKPPYSKPNISMRTRASVNASLNNIANQPKHTNEDEAEFTDDKSALENIKTEHFNGEGDVQDDVDDFDADTDDEETPTYISEPSGLKIKLSLKKANSEDSGDMSTERSTSPPILEPNYTYQLDSVDTMDSFVDEAPPDIMRTQTPSLSSGMAQVRMKDSKYYDKLEVYHRTDEFGRRCCPFCDYKTSKNTIRVHLSGIHKIHFVKCSLCDYKAAFPHQITQHGIKFHKTTNMNVIQLSKESRDRTIAHLKRFGNEVANTDNVPAAAHGPNVDSVAAAMNNKEIIDDVDFNSEESVSSTDDIESSAGMPADERHFKPPKCQTSKTDYYSIRVENGVYMYTCNLCTFQTPVRATIYTHKYRHEEKSYRCGYCDFTSAPRSNVVHHCRVKHKTLPVSVFENEDNDDNSESSTSGSQDRLKESPAGKYPPDIKVNPLDANVIMKNHSANGDVGKYHVDTSRTSQSEDKSHNQTIIKVPQFKRSFAADAFPEHLQTADGTIPTGNVAPGVEYKLSLNKLYRVNPLGSPKFMCALCPYACDTHPKMKHHLYRHRPQKYKCPYCDHRKYPRSYVVRHVRDTHRNKPVRVIDLSKGNQPEDIPEYTNDSLVDDIDDAADNMTGEELEGAIDLDPALANNNEASNDMITEGLEEQHEEVNALKQFAQKLNLRSVLTSDLQDDMYINDPDVNTTITDAAYTSTPLIDSFISGKYANNNNIMAKQQSKNFEKKKSLKDYRVNYGQGPRYICNKCGYGTENYKTIHNHMYRHESQRYQCPYCGYRRSPKSFVENHIREVHKGHPVIVTELNVDQEMSDIQNGSPRQNVSLKRKDPPSDIDSLSSDAYPEYNNVIPTDIHTSSNLPSRWPAPKPVSEVNIGLHPDIKDELSSSLDTDMDCSSDIDHLKSAEGFSSSLSSALSSPSMVSSVNQPVKMKQFVERNRTTFKSIYKCVFDPETCNHISKDKSKMKQHLFMHVEYKPWTCDICDMTASQSSHIKNHVRTEHKFAPDTSFKYKRHNYLEKHIEGFLSRGLYTVPVNEYRAIMDMKGNTKSSKQPCFERDMEGNILCPYCPYRTKTGGMTDHVKMKHMQPRFKCHWCDFTAFYKSEVRKHHRKEKAHGGLDFIVQELDLIQVVERCKNEGTQAIATLNTPNAVTNVGIDPSLYFDEDCDDFNDENSECSSSDSSSLTDFQQGFGDYTTDDLTGSLKEPKDLNEIKDTIEPNDTDMEEINELPLSDNQALSGAINTEIGPDGCMKIVPKSKVADIYDDECSENEDKFRCGYCTFSAALRVKVKMHSSKRHPNLDLNIIEPVTKRYQSVVSENRDLNAADWKGTKFEQDLKRAGVSKLNLASLFPNSKRFVSGSKNSSENKDKRTESSSKIEFKKPLDPVVKKCDKKLEGENDNESDSYLIDDEEQKDDKSINSDKVDKKVSQDLVISNVRSLNDDDSKPSENKIETDSVEDPSSIETSGDTNQDSNESETGSQEPELLEQRNKERGVSEKGEVAQTDLADRVKQNDDDKMINECKDNAKCVDKMPNVESASENDSPNTSSPERDDVTKEEAVDDKLKDSVETSGDSPETNVADSKDVKDDDRNENISRKASATDYNDVKGEQSDVSDKVKKCVDSECKENGVDNYEDSEIPDENEGIYALDGTLKDDKDVCNNVPSELTNDIAEYTGCSKKRKRLDGTEDTTVDFNESSEDDMHPLKKVRTAIDGII